MIGTYFITKSLIRNIEDFLRNNVPQILDCNSEDTAALKMSISILDSFGEEKLPSIENHKHQFFRDDTKGIIIRYGFKQQNKEIRITFRFGKEAKNSELSIYLPDKNARERVSAIEEGIGNILNQAKTINWLFHPNEYIAGAILLVGVGCGILSLEDQYLTIARFYFGLIFWVAAFYFAIYQYLKPYSMFDTNKQKKLNAIYNWLIGGAASFIVFSCFATSVRRNIFGF